MFAMSMSEMFSQLREYVDLKVSAAVSRLVHFTYYAGNSATGTSDTVDCDHTDSSSGTYLARRMQHFGFRSRPPKGVSAIRLGNYQAASNSVIVAEDSDRFGPGDLADGEMAIYNKVSGTTILLDKDGNIKITAGSGADVVVNGGTSAIGRVNDAVQVTIPTGSFLTAASGGVLNAAPVTVTGKITAGAPHFKG